MPVTKTESQLLNRAVFEQLEDPGMQKQALDAINDFTRTRMREEGFLRKIMPPLPIGNDELDRQMHTDKPVKIIDKEPDQPPAISVPFGALPINFYIRGPRYQVAFHRIMSPRFTKDKGELRTWQMDIRQVISDNAIKDMLAEEDSKFISAVNTALGGSAGATTPTSGAVQWQTISGGLTRDGLQEALSVMPKTQFHLESHTILINNVFIRQLLKMGRDEVGGDLSQELLRNGWTEANFANNRWIVTIKRDLVPDGTMFMFADPKFIGKFFELSSPELWLDSKFFFLEWFVWAEEGASLGHTGGLSRVDFS
jgi:hypothetical protein